MSQDYKSGQFNGVDPLDESKKNSEAYSREGHKVHHTSYRGGSSAAGIGPPPMGYHDDSNDYDPQTTMYNSATGSGYSKTGVSAEQGSSNITGPREKGLTGTIHSNNNEVPSSGYGYGQGGVGHGKEGSKTGRLANLTASGIGGIWSGIHVCGIIHLHLNLRLFKCFGLLILDRRTCKCCIYRAQEMLFVEVLWQHSMRHSEVKKMLLRIKS